MKHRYVFQFVGSQDSLHILPVLVIASKGFLFPSHNAHSFFVSLSDAFLFLKYQSFSGFDGKNLGSGLFVISTVSPEFPGILTSSRFKRLKTDLFKILVKSESGLNPEIIHHGEGNAVHKAELFIGIFLEPIPSLAVELARRLNQFQQ